MRDLAQLSTPSNTYASPDKPEYMLSDNCSSGE